MTATELLNLDNKEFSLVKQLSLNWHDEIKKVENTKNDKTVNVPGNN